MKENRTITFKCLGCGTDPNSTCWLTMGLPLKSTLNAASYIKPTVCVHPCDFNAEWEVHHDSKE
ncbi:MAG: hypothetical protein KAS32_02385 [Candidatus Peribacteraceae bacterium]|nr:hypothetical protein [Candidatus Peribacteraceae bacterium]